MLELKDKKAVTDKISGFIKESVTKHGRNGVVLGLSGGIDSALVAYLAVNALGKEKVLALFMPERDSSPLSRKHAYLVANSLGIEMIEINLSSVLRKIGIYRLEPQPLFFPRSFQEKYVLNKYLHFQDKNETTFLKSQKGGEGKIEIMKGNAFLRIKHRLRMIMWYYHAELRNYLVLGCCNKTEKLVGYFVKYGDSGSDIDPIADLYKTQVRELAEYICVPKEIVEKKPAPDLMPGMTDEFALQMPYEKIDIILCGLENELDEDEIIKEASVTKKDLEYIKILMKLAHHMNIVPPCPKIND